MITTVYRGDRIHGLVEYLFGPGRFEEHRNPHIVEAWDPDLVSDSSPSEYDRRQLAHRMDRPRVLQQIDADGMTYHVPVALHLDDGTLTDTQWAQVAHTIADRLGFTADPATGRAECHWIAVHHGPAADGRDHIHFATSLVRSDGSVASTHNDFRTLSRVRQELEAKLNLTVRTRSNGAGMPNLHRGELRASHRRDEPEPARVRLARTVRACATAARDETEFPARLRTAGIQVRARYAPGGQRVVGYAVALPSPPDRPGQSPVWFGGGKLTPDLTLPALRTRWADHAATTDTPTPNLDQVHAAWTGHTARPGARPRTPDARQAWDHVVRVVGRYRAQVATLDPRDDRAWAAVAGETAGVLAALGDRIATSGHRDPRVDRAATALARVAQQSHDRRVDPRRPAWSSAISDAARTMAVVNLAGRGGAVGLIGVLAQLGNLVDTIGRARLATAHAADMRSTVTARRELLTAIRTTVVPPRDPHSSELPDRHLDHENSEDNEPERENEHDIERG